MKTEYVRMSFKFVKFSVREIGENTRFYTVIQTNHFLVIFCHEKHTYNNILAISIVGYLKEKFAFHTNAFPVQKAKSSRTGWVWQGRDEWEVQSWKESKQLSGCSPSSHIDDISYTGTHSISTNSCLIILKYFSVVTGILKDTFNHINNTKNVIKVNAIILCHRFLRLFQHHL